MFSGRGHPYPICTTQRLMSGKYHASMETKLDSSDVWWKRKEDDERYAIHYLQSLDDRLLSALLGNPSDELVTRIAASSALPPKLIRRTACGLRRPTSFFHYIYYKPRNVLCQPNQRNREAEASVYKFLPSGYPYVPFGGRLDADTEGLLFFSDDGKLLNGLVDPSRKCAQRPCNVLKEYYVKVVPFACMQRNMCTGQNESKDEIDSSQWEVIISDAISSMSLPLDVKGDLTKPAIVKHLEPSSVKWMDESSTDTLFINSFWLSVVIDEGKNRQVRRLCRRAGLSVQRLIRVRFGPLSLWSDNSGNHCRAGEARTLNVDEIAAIYDAVSLPSATSIPCPLPVAGQDLLHLVPNTDDTINRYQK